MIELDPASGEFHRRVAAAAWDACANPPRRCAAIGGAACASSPCARSEFNKASITHSSHMTFLSCARSRRDSVRARTGWQPHAPHRRGRRRRNPGRRALLCEIAFARRICLRPRLGRGLRARRRQLLSQAAGLGAVHAGDRAPPARAARPAGARPCAPRSPMRSIDICRRSRRLLRARHLPDRGGMGAPRRARLPASAPISSSIGRTPATRASTTSSPRSPRASARPSGASAREALAHGISVHWLTGSDLTESVWDAFFEFYMETGSRKWGRPYLTRAVLFAGRREDGASASCW